MKKVFLFSITAIMLLSALTGCAGKGNVSTNKDGKITEQTELIKDATDMLSEIMTEPTTEKSTTEATTEHSSTDAVGGETESTEDMTQDNGRSRRIMPRE